MKRIIEFSNSKTSPCREGFFLTLTIFIFNIALAQTPAHVDLQSQLDIKLLAPVFAQGAAGNVSIEKWEKYEIAFRLPGEYEQAIKNFFVHYFKTGETPDVNDLNPYADDSLEVRIDLISPSGKHLIKWAFFMREAKWNAWGDPDNDTLIEDTQNALSEYHWHFRFAPDETGEWVYKINVSTPLWNTPFTTYVFGPFRFNCTSPLPDNHGFIRVGANKQYLQFDDGTPFFGIGENIMGDHSFWWGHSGWPTNCDNHFYRLVFENYKKTLKEMHDAGANLLRSVFWRNTFAFDRNNLGVYDQFYNPLPVCYSPAYTCSLYTAEYGNMQFQIRMLDSIVDYARKENIYLIFMPQSGNPKASGQSLNWGDDANIKYLLSKHRYIKPDSIGLHYYSDKTIRYYDKRMYKYLLARWGYSVNLAMIQPIGEADGIYGYNGKRWIDNLNCQGTNRYMLYIAGLKAAINDWLDDVIGYAKTNPDSGGIGDDKHLYLLTYLGLPSIDSTNYGSFSNYYSLMNNSNIDVNGVSSYWDNMDMMMSRSDQIAAFKKAFSGKPFHISEGSSFGRDRASGKNTYSYYNNYDVSFHNEIWASAFMGITNCISTWNGELIHRWKYSTREVLGKSISATVQDTASPHTLVQTDIIIKSAYHNFKPLADFMSMIDFKQNYRAGSYYGGSLDYLETYYLESLDSANAYGWVHNINKYWANDFYAGEGQHENFFGCYTLPKPATSFTVPGLKHNRTYYIYFFRTRMGNQALPEPQTRITDNSGNLLIDISAAPLGCDSTHADYGYRISEKEVR